MRYSAHSNLRMKQYGITRAEVETVVATVKPYEPPMRDRREHFGYAADGSPINVVTNRARTVVITIVRQ